MGPTARDGDPETLELRPPTRALLPLGDAWTPHRGMAALLVAASVVVPAIVALLVTSTIASDWHRPPGIAWFAGYWLVLVGAAYVIIRAAHIVTRRLVPLAVLLQMGLAFPGAAPSRFRLALHAGNPRRLARPPTGPQSRAREHQALGDAGAAGLMLELVTDLSNHDRATRGHSERVRAYTELLATELGVSDDDRQRLRWSGLLHDIGKLEVPAAILNKPDRLTEAEFEVIRRHPLEGLRLAMPLWAWLGDFVLAVSDHHERWEGGGYPSGASGTDISLAGRIVAVADAFDVMTSSRSYKAPISPIEAREELVRCAGTQFDPDVVRAFLAIDLDRLRSIVGPLAALAPLPAILRQAAALSVPLRSAAGAAGVATAVVTWSLVAPVLPDPTGAGVAAPAASPIESPSPGTNASETVGRRPADDRTTAIESTGRSTSAPDQERGRAGAGSEAGKPGRDPARARPIAPAPGTPDPEPDTVDPPPPGDAGPAPDPQPEPEPVGIIVHPAEGSVAVDGVAPSGPIEVVELAPVGQVACGGIGLCDPIEVDLPITLPRAAA